MSGVLERSAQLPVVSYSAGAEVLREGRARSSRIDEPVAIFGEMSALLGGPVTATVRTNGGAIAETGAGRPVRDIGGPVVTEVETYVSERLQDVDKVRHVEASRSAAHAARA